MEKLKKAVVGIVRSPLLPIYIFALVVAIAHLFMNKAFSDDIWFYSVLEGAEKPFEELKEFLDFRYEHWSSRVLIEGALVLLVRAPFLWQIIDAVAIIYIIFAISRLVNPEKSLTKSIIIALVPLVYPVWVLYEVGFVATSVNYIIPFACLMPTITILYKHTMSEGVPYYEYIIAYALLAFACFSEIMCGAVLLLSIGAIILYSLDKKGVGVAEISFLAIGIFALVYHLMSPGNDARYLQESSTWLSAHPELNIIEKLELGFSSMMFSLFMDIKNILMTVFCVSVALATTFKSKSTIKRVLSWIPVAFSAIFGVLSPIFCKLDSLAGLKGAMLDKLYDPKISFGGILVDLVGVFMLFCILFSLREIISDTRKYIIVFYMLFVGSATKIALGLSPTVWASGGRGATLLYISIAVSLGIAIYDIVEHIKAKKETNQQKTAT